MSSVNWLTTVSRSFSPRALTPSSLVLRTRIPAAMGDRVKCRNCPPLYPLPRAGGGRGREKNAPYSQQLGDLFTRASSVLVNSLAPNYSANGDGRLGWGKSR